MEEGADDIMHTIYGNLAHVNNKLGTYKDSEKYARLAIRKKPDWFKVSALQSQASGRAWKVMTTLLMHSLSCLCIVCCGGSLFEKLRHSPPARWSEW